MTDPARARTSNSDTLREHPPSDPFATPTLQTPDLPTVPKRAAQGPCRPSTQFHHHVLASSATPAGGAEMDHPGYPYKTASMSSAGGSSVTPISSIDLEKSSRRGSDHRKQHGRGREKRASHTHDPEKGRLDSPLGSHERARRVDAHRIAYLEDEEGDLARRLQEQNAVKILLFLSGPCVILSFLNVFWTLISLVITSLAQPVRLCARRPSFGQQLGGLLGPSLNLQLKSIYTPLLPHADEDMSYRPGMLLVVQLLSPFLSLGMMLAAWVVAVYWISSAVVGDPSGTDKRDDGKETVLALRNWWEKWLVKSMKED